MKRKGKDEDCLMSFVNESWEILQNGVIKIKTLDLTKQLNQMELNLVKMVKVN